MKYFVTLGSRMITVDVDGDAILIDGRRVMASLDRAPDTPEVRITIDGVSAVLAIERHDGAMVRLVDRGAVREISVENERARHIRLLAGAARPADRHAALKAPMPGLVLRVLVSAGDRVVAGTPLLALEAMKMENELRATAPGMVGAVRVAPGDAVEKGQVLLELTTG